MKVRTLAKVSKYRTGRTFDMEFEKLKKIIAGVLSVDPNEITMDSTFVDDLGADSLDLFQIVMGIEEEFDVTVEPEKVEKISTVGEAVELIRNTIQK
jgi:acyl carrier protein